MKRTRSILLILTLFLLIFGAGASAGAQGCPTGTPGDDNIVADGTCGTLDTGEGDDTVGNFGEFEVITTGAGNDLVINIGIAGTIDGGDGHDQIDNQATATVTSIIGGNGNDNIYHVGVAESIDAGAGDDVVSIIDTAIVTGIIDGGDGNDSLQFQFGELNSAELSALDALLNDPNAAFSGTITASGRTYTWINFEQLLAFILTGGMTTSAQIVIYAAHIERVNSEQLDAPIAVYCTAQAVEVWDVVPDANGAHGEMAISVSHADALAGLAAAALDGQPVQLGAGLGDTLTALPDGQLLASGPHLDGSGEYQHTFSCG